MDAEPVHVYVEQPGELHRPDRAFPRLIVCVGRESCDRRRGQRRDGYRRTAADRARGIAENDRKFVCRGLCSFGGRDGNSETGKQGDKRSREIRD